jgi:hypothetical protein
MSSARVSVLFSFKKNGSLRLYINYRGLNKITIKDRYPLFFINETLDRLISAAYYTKFNFKDTYRLRKGSGRVGPNKVRVLGEPEPVGSG